MRSAHIARKRKGPDAKSGPWSYRCRRSLVFELRRKELAVQAGDMRDGDLLGTFGLAGTRVGAVAEAQFVHLGDHRLGAAREATSRGTRLPKAG